MTGGGEPPDYHRLIKMTFLDRRRVTPLLPTISIGGRKNEHISPIAEFSIDYAG